MKSKEKLITAFGFINACQLHLKLSVTYCQHQKRLKEDDRCLQVALPVTAFPEMLYKPVGTRGTTATRAVCVRRGLGRKTPFSWGSNIPSARDDRRPSILQLKTDGLIARKISFIEQIAYKNKALVIVLQETRCTTVDKLVVLNSTLAESVLCRTPILVTCVYGHWSIRFYSNQRLSGCA